MIEKIRKSASSSKWNSRTATWLILVFLIICILFLLLRLDDLAQIAAIFIYFSLVATVIWQFIELKNQPERTDKILPDNLGAEEICPPGLDFRLGPFSKKFITAVNILVIVFYLMIFGADLPTKNNHLSFLFLLVILLIINAILFSGSDAGVKNKKDESSREQKISAPKKSFRFGGYLDQKSVILGIIINVVIIMIVYLLFNFNLIVLGLVLIIVNIIILADLANKKYII